MSKRKILGIPLESHKGFALALLELQRFAERPPAPRGMLDICRRLRSELDDHIYAEFPAEHPHPAGVYYPRNDPSFADADFTHGVDGLRQLLDLLREIDPQGKAVHLAEKLLHISNKLADRGVPQSSQERPEMM